MLKRTKGRLLLTLLVVTGFAGTMNNATLTKQERNSVAGLLKESRNDLLNGIKGLSETQLNFKQSPDRWSINECFYRLAQTENRLWELLAAAMKEPAIPANSQKVKISDEDFLKQMNYWHAVEGEKIFLYGIIGEKYKNGSISAFKTSRNKGLKYSKSTTEDLRNHFILLPVGRVDCYQFMLYISEQSIRYSLKIKEIMAAPTFPNKLYFP